MEAISVDRFNTSVNRANYSSADKNLSTKSFSGNLGLIGEQVMSSLPQQKVIKNLKNFEWLRGEMGSILITALGTGLVAPIFIGTNPFVKAPKGASDEEKKEVQNTKWYTALRQPLSAILAIVFQVSALKPIDNFLDKIFNKQEYSKHVNLHQDQCELNGKSYLKSEAKKALKKEGHKKPSIFKGFKEGFAKIKAEREAYDNLLNARVKATASEQINKLAESFQATGKIKIGERFLDNKTLAELVNSQIDTYIQDVQTLKFDANKLAFYDKRATILMGNEAYIKSIFNNLPTDEKELETALKKLLEVEKNQDVKQIIQEILERPRDLRAHRIERTKSRMDVIRQMCENGVYTRENYLKALTERNGKLDEIIVNLKQGKITNPEKAESKTIRDALENLAKNCSFEESNRQLSSIIHDIDTFGTDKNKLLTKIHKDITKGYKKLIESNYKGFNQVAKIIIGVCITLPVTCNTLNWLYPRFMETFSPKLSGVKKPDCDDKKGGRA